MYDDIIGLIMARVHNVGSLPLRQVKVAVYDGDPKKGELIGTSVLPNIDAPTDLNPTTTTAGLSWRPTQEEHEIYVVVDPDGEIENEITTFNNTAHTTLPKKEEEAAPVRKPLPVSSSGRGGR
jgi:hypothetical protein